MKKRHSSAETIEKLGVPAMANAPENGKRLGQQARARKASSTRWMAGARWMLERINVADDLLCFLATLGPMHNLSLPCPDQESPALPRMTVIPSEIGTPPAH
jgi:hypothetical protein